MKNRWGCDYYQFQKFVEIENRYKSINENWDNLPVPYKPEHYEYHNFYKPKSFWRIYSRLFNLNAGHKDLLEGKVPKEICNKWSNAQKANTEFIPYKEALRLK